MPREIQLCLVYRDMWQSSGKYMPNANQLSKVAEPIINMKCWDRIETNGGGFEQIQLLAGENPNEVVRKWTKPFNEVGIKTQMLERGLNALSMSPVSEDVRELMFSVKSKQGTNISRSFDGLNDPRNLELSIKFANASGMISQSCLCITHSKIHTVDYYISLAKKFIELGTKEIAIKDMAGIGRPSSLGKIVKGIKNYSPNTIVQYHGHSGPGFSVASALEVARAGADIVDVSMEPLSWGTTHADLLTIHEVLKDDGFIVKDFDKKAYMEVKQLTQEFIDESLGYYINQKNRLMNSLLISSGLPGGMMGSLMSDLEKSHLSINKWLKKNKSDEINIDFLFSMLSDEVNEIWPKMGYPPLVTPYSQYVKNVALVNVLNKIKGKERWGLIDDNTWDMLLGKSGRLPAPLGDEIINLSRKLGKKFYKNDPQDLVKNVLEKNREGGKNLARLINDSVENIRNCSECRNLTEKTICDICSDEKRNKKIICVVESPTDVLAIENSGSFKGKYFVLMGRLSPIDGVTPQDLGIPKLIERVKSSDIDEIIIATSPTIEGDATSFYIKDQLNENKILISRIAYGVPMGGELEYVDNTTLGRAIQGRREIN
mgnify:CR=1 FL=1